MAVSGTVTFDRVPFGAPGSGLDYASTVQAPVREVTIEAIANDGTNTVIDSAQTDNVGAYTLTVPVNTSVFVRVKAVMGSFRVCDNTAAGACSDTAGGQLHFFDDAPFDSGAAATLARTPFNIPSGWGGAAYTSPREAAPFAILDTVYQARQLVLSAEAGAAFPGLNIYWSPLNKASDAINIATGDIIGTFYDPGVSPDTTNAGVRSLYVLGDADGVDDDDTDEYDQHVILRAWAQYYLNTFSRLDNDVTVLGDTDDPAESYDLRTAFVAGWGDAFAAMATGDPVYRDTFGIGQNTDFNANVETFATPDPGWFSEPSIAVVLYDLFDDDADDPVNGSFSLIHTAMTGMTSIDAFVSIYPFVNRYIAAAPAQTAQVTSLLNSESIAVAPDDFGSTETNDGGDPVTLNYNGAGMYVSLIAPAGTARVYSTDFFGFLNALGNRGYVVLDVPAGQTVSSITATTVPACTLVAGAVPDPDIVLFRQGVEIARSEDGDPDTGGPDTETLNSADGLTPLGAGRYLIEVYDADNVFGPLLGIEQTGETCFDVTVSP